MLMSLIWWHSLINCFLMVCKFSHITSGVLTFISNLMMCI